MNYYYDCEFLEGTQDKKIFGIKVGQTKQTIDLISIGILSEDGCEYYAISKDFNLKEAWNRYDLQETSPAKKYMGFYEEKVYWIRENVLRPIFIELWENEKGAKLTNADFNSGIFNYKNIKKLISKYGKSNKQIADEVFSFVNPTSGEGTLNDKKWNDHLNKFRVIATENKPLKLYGYYSAYDHVVLCWLFGKMNDLPNGFPMYTIDLKQMLDEKANNIIKLNMKSADDFKGALDYIKKLDSYPKETNSHNALADAKWNKELHTFIKSL